MTLANLLRKGILTVTLGAGAFFAKDALAQGFDNKQDWDKPAQQAAQSKQLDDNVDGAFSASAKLAPKEEAITLSGFLTYKHEDLRPSLVAISTWQKFENDIPLEVATNRIQARIGMYLQQVKDSEIFFNPTVGFEHRHFTGAISNDASKGILGADIGLAYPETGTKLLVGVYGGLGKYDAELLSGFRSDGSYSTFFLGVSATQRLLGQGKKPIKITGEFDQKDIGEEFRYSMHAAIDAVISRERYGELRDETMGNLRLAMPHVLNLREYGRDAKGNIYAKGTRLQFTPYVELQTSEAGSDISRSKFKANKYRMGITAEAQVSEWVAFRVGAGYQWQRLDNNGRMDDKDGLTAELALSIRR